MSELMAADSVLLVGAFVLSVYVVGTIQEGSFGLLCSFSLFVFLCQQKHPLLLLCRAGGHQPEAC